MRNMYETPVRIFRNGVVKTVPAGEVQENDVVSVLGQLHVVTLQPPHARDFSRE